MPATAAPAGRQLVPFAALSASYFAHIGFFNPYLPLWLKHLGLPIVVISLVEPARPRNGPARGLGAASG